MLCRGKKLEKEIKNSLVKHSIFHVRLPDARTAGGFAAPMPADFIIFPNSAKVAMIEAKEISKVHLPISNFRPSQLKAMTLSQYTECEYYIIVKLCKQYILINRDDILRVMENEEKSLNLQNYYIFKTISQCIDFLCNQELTYD